jgi:SM-20-related protein
MIADHWSDRTDWIDQLAQLNYAVIEDFIPAETSSLLRANLIEEIQNENLRQAGIGTLSTFQKVKSVRGDRIKWLETNDSREGVQAYFQRINLLMDVLKRTCFLPIRDFEMHLAHYPIGTHYDRHIDQFNHRSSRLISVVTYLNENWQSGDGGEIAFYPKNSEAIIIPPKLGTTVIFRSEVLEHEVLKTQTDRYSITGWLLNQPKGTGFLAY